MHLEHAGVQNEERDVDCMGHTQLWSPIFYLWKAHNIAVVGADLPH